MKSEWKSGIKIEDGKELYKVFRLIDKSLGDLPQNRQYMSKTYIDRENAQEIAEMYNEKECFVYELGELLFDYGVENIEKLRYDIDLEKKTEKVTITFKNQYKKEIDVTARSLRGITRDIMRKL